MLAQAAVERRDTRAAIRPVTMQEEAAAAAATALDCTVHVANDVAGERVAKEK